MSNRFDGDTQVIGNLVVTEGIAAGDAYVDNAAVEAGAEISEAKHEHRVHALYSDQIGTNAATGGRVLYRCYATGATVLKFGAGSVVAAGAATTLTIDLKKNGASILSATFTLDNANTAYVIEDPAGFSSTSLVVGDVLTAHWTLAGANPQTGFFCDLIVKEKGV